MSLASGRPQLPGPPPPAAPGGFGDRSRSGLLGPLALGLSGFVGRHYSVLGATSSGITGSAAFASGFWETGGCATLIGGFTGALDCSPA